NLITTGPPFSLLRLVGVDVGWVPAFPSQIADAINGTDYLSVLGLANVRIPIVVGFGLGAFAAGLAYGSVVNALPSQPGGLQDSNPLASSVTLLPMILLRNPGRANGGLFARLDPLPQLFGFSTRTPDFELENSDGLLTGATLLPIKIDAAMVYDILSDFPAWPNPFSLLNSLMGMLFPTYMLRGLDLGALLPQLGVTLEELLDDPAAINRYPTMPANTLPLLEPLYLFTDVLSIVLGRPIANPLANALAPALSILVNLGYTDVDPEDGYDRLLDQAGVPTGFFTLPNLTLEQWLRVPLDVLNALVAGFYKEFFSGNPTPATPNAIEGLLGVLDLVDDLPGLGDLPIGNVFATEDGGVQTLGDIAESLVSGEDADLSGELPDLGLPDVAGKLPELDEAQLLSRDDPGVESTLDRELTLTAEAPDGDLGGDSAPASGEEGGVEGS